MLARAASSIADCRLWRGPDAGDAQIGRSVGRAFLDQRSSRREAGPTSGRPQDHDDEVEPGVKQARLQADIAGQPRRVDLQDFDDDQADEGATSPEQQGTEGDASGPASAPRVSAESDQRAAEIGAEHQGRSHLEGNGAGRAE